MKGVLCVLLLGSCVMGKYNRRHRNSMFTKKCPVHHVLLIKDTVTNELGAWCSIEIDKERTPYPRIGNCAGCTGTPPESIIKFCSECDSEFKLSQGQ